jgi:hypothetical protein
VFIGLIECLEESYPNETAVKRAIRNTEKNAGREAPPERTRFFGNS